MHGGKELIAPLEMRFDKGRVNGKMNVIAGRVKRQVGEWTGDNEAQAEGLAQEMKGKAQQAWSGVKEALRALQNKALAAQNHKSAENSGSRNTARSAIPLLAYRTRKQSPQR